MKCDSMRSQAVASKAVAHKARSGLYRPERGRAASLSLHSYARVGHAAFASLRMAFLEEAEHFPVNQEASVATLRDRRSTFRNPVHLHRGMAFILVGIPDERASGASVWFRRSFCLWSASWSRYTSP